MATTKALTMAVPKGRVLTELQPILARANIYPEDAFFDETARQLQFSCRGGALSLIRVRSFDVPTFVAFGGADVGVCGSDVLAEYDYDDVYQPLDLQIGRCRLSVAGFPVVQTMLKTASHVRVATKYPRLTQAYFAARGIQAECIKLSGAMELAPGLGLAQCIVDLVSTGQTLAANGLIEVEVIASVSSRLILNRSVCKTRYTEVQSLIQAFREAAHGA